MQITISKQALKGIVKALKAYKTNCELADLNLYGADHPYCNDPNRYKEIQHYIDRLEKEESRWK